LLCRDSAQQLESVAAEDLVGIGVAAAAVGQELGKRGEAGVAGQDRPVVGVHVGPDGDVAGADQLGQADDLVVLAAVVLGSLLAVAVAVGLSPLAPLGPVRPVYPSPGIAWDWTVLGATPVILAAGLAAGAIAALGLTLTASVARRRRDLALLKALGFTGRQLRAAVSWQSTVAAVIGVVIGAPLGIILGRQLWILFARNVNAVPDATVPALSVLLVALGALVFANLVAAFPGHTASRSPTALVLRAE
jgi:FtsX-like permease family